MNETRVQRDARETRQRQLKALWEKHHQQARLAGIRLAEPSEVSEQFLQGMADRMAVSMLKYGPWDANAGKEDLHAQVELRWQAYLRTGNTEFLMDVANLAMMEFMHPTREGAYFEPTGSEQSPGIITMAGDRIHVGQEAAL